MNICASVSPKKKCHSRVIYSKKKLCTPICMRIILKGSTVILHNLALMFSYDFVFYDRRRVSPYQDVDDGFFNLKFVI
jgi:hypothetical protein